jgi:Tfp pilus assembly protein PilF
LELKEALPSYHRAIEVAPDYAESYESIGYFLDAVEDNPEEAKYYFEEAAKRQ